MTRSPAPARRPARGRPACHHGLPAVVEVEEVRMRRQRSRHHRLAPIALAALVLLAACGSDAPPAAPAGKANPMHERNERYLRSLSWKPEQARCVGRKVSVDLEVLLKGGEGDPDPTKEQGYQEFAAAVRVCIDQDDDIVTTTTGG
jgi:hypothetical protein